METPISLLLFLVVLPVMVLAFLVASLRRKKRKSEIVFAQGLEYIKLMRKLLTYIQQHRGLTMGYLNGDRSVKTRIHALAQQIAHIILQVQSTEVWIGDNGKWFSLIDHWHRLSHAYLQIDADNNFKQHNILIANLLYLIEEVADVHHLAKLDGGTLDTDWRYLLSIAEYIGQARALGTGVAARGECSSVMRIQLNHLRTKIAGSIETVWPEKYRREICSLLECMESQLIIEKPTISANDYFSLATRCIDHLFEQFDRQIDNLQFYRR